MGVSLHNKDNSLVRLFKWIYTGFDRTIFMGLKFTLPTKFVSPLGFLGMLTFVVFIIFYTPPSGSEEATPKVLILIVQGLEKQFGGYYYTPFRASKSTCEVFLNLGGFEVKNHFVSLDRYPLLLF